MPAKSHRPLRSNRPDTRNPVLALPSLQQLLELDPHQRGVLAAVLTDLQLDARRRAESSWKKHKGPMALYWRCVSTYAGQIARAIKPRTGSTVPRIR